MGGPSNGIYFAFDGKLGIHLCLWAIQEAVQVSATFPAHTTSLIGGYDHGLKHCTPNPLKIPFLVELNAIAPHFQLYLSNLNAPKQRYFCLQEPTCPPKNLPSSSAACKQWIAAAIEFTFLRTVL